MAPFLSSLSPYIYILVSRDYQSFFCSKRWLPSWFTFYSRLQEELASSTIETINRRDWLPAPINEKNLNGYGPLPSSPHVFYFHGTITGISIISFYRGRWLPSRLQEELASPRHHASAFMTPASTSPSPRPASAFTIAGRDGYFLDRKKSLRHRRWKHGKGRME
jgi:hypothetical protein